MTKNAVDPPLGHIRPAQSGADTRFDEIITGAKKTGANVVQFKRA